MGLAFGVQYEIWIKLLFTRMLKCNIWIFLIMVYAYVLDVHDMKNQISEYRNDASHGLLVGVREIGLGST